MYFALVGLWLFAAFSINAEKNLPQSWLRPLGLVQLIVGGLALAFGLYCIVGDAISPNTMSSGFGILVGAIIAFPGLMLILAGRLSWRANEEEEDIVLTDSESLADSPYLAPISRDEAEETPAWMSTGKKIAVAALVLGLVGWIIFICLGTISPTGEQVLFTEIRADNPPAFEFTVSEPRGGKYLIVVDTGKDSNWQKSNLQKRRAVSASYKFDCAVYDPDGREIFRKKDDYYSSADRKLRFVPAMTGTYRLSVKLTPTVKGSLIYPSVRVYRQ